ncbi:MAG TPA: type II secretion system minor pseudopilin GspJ [Casimicrobiaceae bacterium]|nr:type II secretion system minor pseudopilin GspJ [Casimicrobiaceae bacterium]
MPRVEPGGAALRAACTGGGRGRSHAPPPRGAARGFTLVEALVAIAILGVVALLAWRATDAMTRSQAQISRETRHWQQLDAVFARMEADMRRAIPREVRMPALQPAWSAVPADAEGDTLLAFSRAGPYSVDEPGAAGQRVGYDLRRDRLEVMYWPQLDDPTGAAPVAYTLADGVARFRVLQLTGSGAWSATWPRADEDAIPRAVRVELTLEDGSLITRTLALR